MADKIEEEEIDLNTEEVDTKSDGKDFKGMLLQIGAFVVGFGLFIADRHLHYFEPPVESWIYGVFGAVALGKTEALSMLGMGKK
jgi:hypothetical protein